MWGDKTAETILNFEKRDFLYDNGLVNIFLTLQQDPRFEKVDGNTLKYKNSELKLNHLKLQFSGNFEEIKEIYFILRSIYYSKVFEETANNKPYYDEDNDKVVIGKVLNVKPFLQRSERTKDLLPTISLPYQKLEELKEEEEVVKEDFSGKITGSLLYGSRPLKDKFLPPDKLGKVNVYLTPKKLGENIAKRIEEFISAEKCTFCGLDLTKYKNSDGKKKSFAIASTNLIFDFGTGDLKPSFRDSRTKNDIPICFICDLIYRYGLMKNYFVNNNVFIISAPSLQLLLNLKNILMISENYSEEVNTKTNFLEKNDFVTSGMYSRMLLLLYKIKSKALNRDELSLLSMFYFIVTGRGVNDLKAYNKVSYIVNLFERTRNVKSQDKQFLHSLINYAYYKDISTYETKNIPREELSREILEGMPIDSNMADLSYYNLSLDSPSGLNPTLLYEFLKEYLEAIGMKNLKELHEICMLVGDRIGYFAGTLNNKNLLYPLREIGNIEGLTGFFKDLEYEIMKEDAGAIWNSKLEGKDKNYSELIREILLNAQNNQKIILIRNYLAIYAVQKYLSTKFAKSKGGA